jgi:multiple sugar transport system ATP-binding protein
MAPETPEDRRMKVEIVLREALGSEVLVHFAVDAPPVLTEDTRELVGAQSGPMAQTNVVVEELEKAAAVGTSTFVARLDPRTTAAERHSLELAVDTTRLHFFDPETGLGVYGDGT